MSRSPRYASRTHTLSRRGVTITVENKIPELTEPERLELSGEIEAELYDIFAQYEGSVSRAAGV